MAHQNDECELWFNNWFRTIHEKTDSTGGYILSNVQPLHFQREDRCLENRASAIHKILEILIVNEVYLLTRFSISL